MAVSTHLLTDIILHDTQIPLHWCYHTCYTSAAFTSFTVLSCVASIRSLPASMCPEIQAAAIDIRLEEQIHVGDVSFW